MKKSISMNPAGFAAMMAMAAMISFTSCTKEDQVSSFEPVSWTPDSREITLLPGETAKIYGTVVFSDGRNTENIEAVNINAESGDVVWTYGGWKMVGLVPGTETVTANVRMTGPWNGKKEFYQDVTVKVVNPEKPIIGIEISPAEVAIKSGEKVDFKVYAVYEDSKREISPVVCKFDVTDDGSQHISYTFSGMDAYVNGSQGTGNTYINVTYTENGVTVNATSLVKSVVE